MQSETNGPAKPDGVVVARVELGDNGSPRLSQQQAPQLGSKALDELRSYLLVIAQARLDPSLKAQVAPSDVVQDTLVIAHQRLDGFRGTTVEELRAWARKILLRHMAKLVRRQLPTRVESIRQTGREGAVSASKIADDRTPASQIAQRNERHRAIRAAMQCLPDHYTRVIRWRIIDRMAFAEIGARAGVSEEAARKLWKRGLFKLKKLLGTKHAP